MSAPELAFAGFLITRPVRRPEGMDPSLIPERIVTASSCFARFLPDIWALSWANVTEEERLDPLATFGIPAARFPELALAVDEMFKRGNFVFPNFVSDELSVSELLRWTGGYDDLIVLGLGLPAEGVSQFAQDFGRTQYPIPDLVSVVEQRRRLPHGGELRGFELLAFSPPATNPHTQICNGIEKELLARHEARLNRFGLLDDVEFARRWAEEVTREQLGEPLLWLPWAVVDYTAHFRSSAGATPRGH